MLWCGEEIIVIIRYFLILQGLMFKDHIRFVGPNNSNEKLEIPGTNFYAIQEIDSIKVINRL